MALPTHPMFAQYGYGGFYCMVVTTVYGLQLFLFLGAGYFSFTASQDDVLRLDDDNRDLKRLKIAAVAKKVWNILWAGTFCLHLRHRVLLFLAADSGSQRARRRGRLRDLGSPPGQPGDSELLKIIRKNQTAT